MNSKWIIALSLLAGMAPLHARAADARQTVRAAIDADDHFPSSLYTVEFVTAHGRAQAKDSLAAEGGLTGEAGTGRIEVRSMHVVGHRVLADIFSPRDGAAPLRKTITFFIAPNGRIADVDTNTRGKYRSATGPIEQMPTLLRRYQDVLREKHGLSAPLALSTQTAEATDEPTQTRRGAEQPDYPRTTARELYATYRKRLQISGWKPSNMKVNPAVCGTTDERCNAFSEVVSCSGTARANCKFRWLSGSTELIIDTSGTNDIIDSVYVQKSSPALPVATAVPESAAPSSNINGNLDSRQFNRVATMLDRTKPGEPLNKVDALLNRLKPEPKVLQWSAPPRQPIETLNAERDTKPDEPSEVANRARITAMFSHEAPMRKASTGRSLSRRAEIKVPQTTSQTDAPEVNALEKHDEEILDDIITDQLRACWSYSGKSPSKGYIPTFRVKINRDGMFGQIPEIVKQPTDSNQADIDLAESGLKALLKCQPLQLPKRLLYLKKPFLRREIRFDPAHID